MLLPESHAPGAGPSVAPPQALGSPCLALHISQATHTGPHHCCLAVSLTFWGLKLLSLFCFDFQSRGGVFIFLSKWETLLCRQAPSKSVLLKQNKRKTFSLIENLSRVPGTGGWGCSASILLSQFVKSEGKLVPLSYRCAPVTYLSLFTEFQGTCFNRCMLAARMWVCVFP